MKKISKIVVAISSYLLLSCTTYKIEVIKHKSYTLYTPMHRIRGEWRKGTPLFDQKLAEATISDWKQYEESKKLTKLYIKIP